MLKLIPQICAGTVFFKVVLYLPHQIFRPCYVPVNNLVKGIEMLYIFSEIKRLYANAYIHRVVGRSFLVALLFFHTVVKETTKLSFFSHEQ